MNNMGYTKNLDNNAYVDIANKSGISNMIFYQAKKARLELSLKEACWFVLESELHAATKDEFLKEFDELHPFTTDYVQEFIEYNITLIKKGINWETRQFQLNELANYLFKRLNGINI
jgi:hypothetical protein